MSASHGQNGINCEEFWPRNDLVNAMSLSDLTTLTAAFGFTERNDPFQLFAEWLADAEKSEPNDPNGMALATVDEEGLPNVRMVLLKDADERGFVFYTNYESQKGQEILGTMKAALCFHWKSLRRQVRVRGIVEQVTAAEADAYFASRARDSRIGAWASQQSRALEGRFALGSLRCLICRQVCFWRRAAPAPLVRLPHQAAIH